MLCVNRDVPYIYIYLCIYPVSVPVAGSGHNGKVLEESGCTHLCRNATSSVTYLMDLNLSHARAAGGTMFDQTLAWVYLWWGFSSFSLFSSSFWWRGRGRASLEV